MLTVSNANSGKFLRCFLLNDSYLATYFNVDYMNDITIVSA